MLDPQTGLDLTLVSTDSLIEEFTRRCDAFVLIRMRDIPVADNEPAFQYTCSRDFPRVRWALRFVHQALKNPPKGPQHANLN
jgi:hypothetical protein